MFYINEHIETKERFATEKFMEFSEGTYDPLTSYFMNQIHELPEGGYTAVRGEEGRPESLSFNIYGTMQLWWILMEFNDVIEIDELISDMNIKNPTLRHLEDLYFRLKALKKASEVV